MKQKYYEYDWFNSVSDVLKFLNENQDVVVCDTDVTKTEDGYDYYDYHVLFYRDSDFKKIKKQYDSFYMEFDLDFLNSEKEINIIGVFKNCEPHLTMSHIVYYKEMEDGN